MKSEIPVIDLFAGPGGLGEGFASLSDFYRIDLSAECSGPAHRTLQLRAFKRILERENFSLDCYYDYLHGHTLSPVAPYSKDVWEQACAEALKLQLGQPDDDKLLARELEERQLEPHGNWVLIGGPPCQAYSVVGRARNRSKLDYVPEDDERHFLYREYLKLIQHFRPAVFVMENVKGMLTSRVGGRKIFHQILEDLTRPDDALGRERNGFGYRIHSLVDKDSVYHHGDNPDGFGQDAFLVYAENFDIPQSRHRVFLVGVREDIEVAPELLEPTRDVPLRAVLDELPALRSGLSRDDSEAKWRDAVRDQGYRLISQARNEGLHAIAAGVAAHLNTLANTRSLSQGDVRVPKRDPSGPLATKDLQDWLRDPNLEVWLNHHARSHMPSDLGRYLYAAVFAECYERSPVGATDFILPCLAPNHANWASGKFADRFRVQRREEASKTITSHISKDGHYYIHPDPWQCRSFTVREAARIQTFPDNYFFEGNRTEQFHQVGNAVPPWLARQIARIVRELLVRAGRGDVDEPVETDRQQIAMPLG